MKFIKQYRLVVAIFLLVLFLVMLRTFSRHDFRYDAVRWAVPSVMGSNTVTEDQMPGMSGEILLVSLGNGDPVIEQPDVRRIMINPESILEKENLSLIRKNKGPVILYSEDNSVSARIWMVLSEMGIRNIYSLQVI